MEDLHDLIDGGNGLTDGRHIGRCVYFDTEVQRKFAPVEFEFEIHREAGKRICSALHFLRPERDRRLRLDTVLAAASRAIGDGVSQFGNPPQALRLHDVELAFPRPSDLGGLYVVRDPCPPGDGEADGALPEVPRSTAIELHAVLEAVD